MEGGNRTVSYKQLQRKQEEKTQKLKALANSYADRGRYDVANGRTSLAEKHQRKADYWFTKRRFWFSGIYD
jgi:hypothetical protein